MRVTNTLLLLLLLTCLLLGSFACRAVAPGSENGEPRQQAQYIGCSSTMVFHGTDCRYCDIIKPENRVEFFSVEEALNAGYRPCKACKPGGD